MRYLATSCLVWQLLLLLVVPLALGMHAANAETVVTVTQMTYDANGRLQCTAVRMNSAVFGSLPASACSLGTQGSNGPDRITKNFYDAAGELVQVRNGVGTSLEQANVTYGWLNPATSQFEARYTPNGKRQYVIDANGNKAKLEYDGFDRQSKWIFPSKTRPTAFNPANTATVLSTAGSINMADHEQYGYDANANRTGLRKRDGRFICNQFDALNRARVKFYLSTTSNLAVCQTTTSYGSDATFYGYDLRNLQLYARYGSTSGAGVTATYDSFGRLTSSADTTGGANRTLGYQHDANGNRTRLTYPDSNYITFDYDGLDRMTLVKESGSTTVGTFVYNSKGERDCWYANTSSNCAAATSGSTNYEYDPIGRLASIAHNIAGTAMDVTFCMGTGNCTPSYNAASQVLARTISNDAYAVRGQYNADRTYAANGLNQYTTAGATNPTYDDNGNLTFADGTTYAYDIENRLTSASGATNATLAYDPLGRLNTTVEGSGTTRFLYDGDELVAEYDGAGTLVKRYVHGPNTDEPTFWYEGSALGNAARRILRADHQGSIVAIIDGANTNQSINSYDEWGNPGPTNTGRFAYTGQIVIPELRLYYYKARIYAPRLGRFLQTDPVGYADQINLYAYVANDPLNSSDTSGMDGAQIGFKMDIGTGVYSNSSGNVNTTLVKSQRIAAVDAQGNSNVAALGNAVRSYSDEAMKLTEKSGYTREHAVTASIEKKSNDYVVSLFQGPKASGNNPGTVSIGPSGRQIIFIAHTHTGLGIGNGSVFTDIAGWLAGRKTVTSGPSDFDRTSASEWRKSYPNAGFMVFYQSIDDESHRWRSRGY